MLVIKNANVFSPKALGKKDVLIAGGKIIAVEDEINISSATTYDALGLVLTPGFIDSHVHITGGGGEAGFKSMVPPLGLSEFIKAGVTTCLGLLGTDGVCRSVKNLVAKAKGLKEEGLSVYALCGSYAYPSLTLTGDVGDDIVFVDEIIGVKLAFSDHRDAAINAAELARLGSKARVAGMLSSKAGIVVLHTGNSKEGLSLLNEVFTKYNVPKTVFRPTHVNKTKELLKQGEELLKQGGYIDLTCGIYKDLSPACVVKDFLEKGLNLSKLSVSSDAGGSFSSYDEDGNLTKIGVSSLQSLYEEFKSMLSLGIRLEIALSFFTSNVAKALKLYPQKGCLLPGSDADLLLMHPDDYSLVKVFAKGKLMLDKEDAGFKTAKGCYEL